MGLQHLFVHVLCYYKHKNSCLITLANTYVLQTKPLTNLNIERNVNNEESQNKKQSVLIQKQNQNPNLSFFTI